MRRLAVLAALPLLLPAITACGVRAEPTGNLAAFPQRLTDGAGRTVVVRAAPRRVLSLDPGLTATLRAVGAGSRLLPVPAGLSATDAAAIAALRPDLVLLPAAVTAAAAGALSRRLGSPVYVAGSAGVAAIEHDIGQIGLAVGNGAGGGALERRLATRIHRLAAAVRGDPQVPVFLDGGRFVPLPSTGFTGLLLKLAGGTDVAAGAIPGRPFPFAQLRAAAPQAYVSLRGHGPSLRVLRRLAATRSLPAVRGGRFAWMSAADLSDPGARVGSVLARLVSLLHPDAVASGA